VFLTQVVFDTGLYVYNTLFGEEQMLDILNQNFYFEIIQNTFFFFLSFYYVQNIHKKIERFLEQKPLIVGGNKKMENSFSLAIRNNQEKKNAMFLSEK
jgi:hypothetical protein